MNKEEAKKWTREFQKLHGRINEIDNVSLYFQYKKFLFLQEFIKNNKKGRVLDLGSNIGHFSFYLYEKGFEVVGIDIDKRFLGESSNEAKRRRYKIKFINASGTKIPFDNESFDYVFALDVLEHIPDKEKCLNEVNRVLKKGGKFIAALPNVFSYYFGRKGLFSILGGNWNKHYGMTAGTVHYRFPFYKWMNYLKKAKLYPEEISSDIILPIEPKLLQKLRDTFFGRILEGFEDNIKTRGPFKYLGSSFNVICRKR